MKPTFIISCPIDTYSGYGARGRDVAKAVIELDKYDHKDGVLHLGVLLKTILNGNS